MVKLCPYWPSSAIGIPYLKLAKRYYGPFRVFEQISKVAYKLLLSDNSQIHLVFYCSLLKPFHSSSPDAPQPISPPASDVDNHPFIAPLTIISNR